ncbi:MAG TPA: DUF2231 domain-containing protein [Candidatus Angelobacter sp.]
MVNPFDIKSALMARHAQHVVLVHFPIALFLSAVGFDFAARWMRKSVLATAAYINFLGAAATSLPVVATGILAWRWQLEGQRLKGVLEMHLVMGLSSAALICVIGWLQFRARKACRPAAPYVLAMEGFAALVVALTGHLGGFLSGVNLGG